MKKKVITSLATMTLLAIGLNANVGMNSLNVVNAAGTSYVHVGKRAKLIQASCLYNYQGKRISHKVVKKGRYFKILGYKTIHGKKYVRIAKNTYIKLANFKSLKPFKKSKKVTSNSDKKVNLLVDSYIYNISGKKVKGYLLKNGSSVPYLGFVVIHGQRYVQIGENEFIKAVNTNESTNNIVNNKQNNSSDSKEINNSSNIVNNSDVNNSFGNNTSTSDEQNHSTDNKDYDHLEYDQPSTNPTKNVGKKLRLQHSCYIYDENGHHILPVEYLNYKDMTDPYDILGVRKIDDDYYYQILYFRDDGENRAYLKASAFDKPGKDEPVQKVSDEAIKNLKFVLLKYDGANGSNKYNLSDYKLKLAYDSASNTANYMISQRWATYYVESSDDARRAGDNLIKAYHNLNGDYLYLKQTDSESLDSQTQKKVLDFVNKVEGSTDAMFIDKENRKISYTQPDTGWLMTKYIEDFVKFDKK